MCADRSQSVAFSEPAPAPTVDATQQIRLSCSPAPVAPRALGASSESTMYARINPDRLALLSLCRAANALNRVTADPTTWFFIILDLHRALYAALVAALSAFSFEDAYGDKLRSQWKEF
jgi:hypothetical protein